jgi:hypothetical protein
MSWGQAGRYCDTCEDDYNVAEVMDDDSDKPNLPGCAPVSAPVKAPTDANAAAPAAKPVSIPVLVPVRPPRMAPVARPTSPPYSHGDDDKNVTFYRESFSSRIDERLPVYWGRQWSKLIR